MIENFKFLDTCERMGWQDTYDKTKSIMLSQEAQHPGKSFAFVGINPPVGQYSLKELYEFCVNNYPYSGYTMCVEQNTLGGIRPHLHILHPVTDNTRKNHIIARLAKVFTIPPEAVQVSVSRSSTLVSRWMKYIQGEKKEEKKDNVEKDIKDREYYNIPHIYNGSGTYEI